MNSYEKRERPRRRGDWALAVVSVLLMGSLAGCSVYLGAGLWSDPRISMDEFLELEEEACLAAVPTTQPVSDQEAAKAILDQQLGPYKIGPRDVLTVLLTEVSGLVGGTNPVPVRVRVDRHGQIDLPIVGKVKVENMELEDIEDLITETYVPKVYREAICHVDLGQFDATEVIIKGAVGRPGLIQLRRTERNLLYALVGAGGISDDSSGWVTLQRLRRPDATTRLNITDPEGIKQALMLDPLEDGDIVTAEPADPYSIIVGGLVKAGGEQYYRAGRKVTILQVLAAARGVRDDMYVHEATLTRRFPDGREVRVKLDLERLASGKVANFVMQPGDILWVNHTWDTWMQDWFNQHAMLTMSGTASASANATYSGTAQDQLNHRGEANAAQPSAGVDPFGFLQRGFLLNQRNNPAATP